MGTDLVAGSAKPYDDPSHARRHHLSGMFAPAVLRPRLPLADSAGAVPRSMVMAAALEGALPDVVAKVTLAVCGALPALSFSPHSAAFQGSRSGIQT
jgi:hypothetical protein